MELLQSIFAWINENWGTIATVAGAAYALALVLVNLTPTPKDNDALAKVYKVAMFLAGLWTREAQGLRPDGTPKV